MGASALRVSGGCFAILVTGQRSKSEARKGRQRASGASLICEDARYLPVEIRSMNVEKEHAGGDGTLTSYLN